jgi:hypothetical protein
VPESVLLAAAEGGVSSRRLRRCRGPFRRGLPCIWRG